MEKMQLTRQQIIALAKNLDNPKLPHQKSFLMRLFGKAAIADVFEILISHLPSAKHTDGIFYKSDIELARETGLSTKTIERARKILKEAAFDIYIKKANGTPINHYRFDMERFIHFVAQKFETDAERVRSCLESATRTRTSTTELELSQPSDEEFRQIIEQYCTSEYAQWAIMQLTRKQKEFLKATIEAMLDIQHPTWKDVCAKAGVASEKRYIKRLLDLKLLLVRPAGGVVRNAAIKMDMLELPTVRHISKSLRFDVFQRDNHTCQYCGRTPPEVVLVVDHLTPVAKNGTDDFDNLITSCKDCNDGKTDKLIKKFTGGISKEEWREHLRNKRTEMLQQRHERLEEVAQHWRKTLGKSYLETRDNKAIHTFIELYKPDWIKAAIEIAMSKKVDNYIKYTVVILRNWTESGPPEYVKNLDSRLEDRPATQKQIDYIQALLKQFDLNLEQFYPKHDLDQLTLLDARNLIRALTEKLEE